MIFILSFIVFIFGLIIGSFLNYVIYRLSLESYSFYKDLFNLKSRSYCPHCKHVLNWMDLFPVFSFVFLKGRCRYCGKKISIQYLLVEVSTALVFLIVSSFKFQVSSFGFYDILNLFFLFYILSSMIVIFAYDLKRYIIPDKILFPAIFITLGYRFFGFFNFNQPSFFINHILEMGNFIAAAALASIFFLMIFLVSRGKWIGFGDVKLAILLGLLLGFPNILIGMFLAFFFGAIIGIIAILLNKKGLKSEIPFAPFLITGTLMALFWGQSILNWYMRLFLF